MDPIIYLYQKIKERFKDLSSNHFMGEAPILTNYEIRFFFFLFCAVGGAV